MQIAKRPIGRPTLYKPEYCELIVKFFEGPHFTIKDISITKPDGTTIEKTEMEALPPLYLSDFARSVGLPIGYRDLFMEWSQKYPDFADALKEAKNLECERIRTNAIMGLYNPTFSIFTMKNISGWRDEQHLKTELNEKKEININLNGLTSEELRTLIQASREKALRVGASGVSKVRQTLDTNKVG